MKAKPLLIMCFFIHGLNGFAAHYSSGDITFRITNSYQVEATVTTYSRYYGPGLAADRDTITISWGDGTHSTLARTNGTDADMNGFLDGIVISNSPATKKSEYSGTYTYSGAPAAGFYIISFFDNNRVDGIVNMDGGTSVNIPFYLEDTIFFNTSNANIGFNSSPVFITPPVFYANLSDTFTFNPVVFDADGDSISIELTTPLQDQGVAVPLYSYPDQYCRSQGQMNSFIQVDGQTGHIRWAPPCVMGIFSIAILVHEYRCGILLSTVMSDMLIIALNEPNDPPVLLPISDYFIQPGGSVSFYVTAGDPNSQQTVAMEAYGGAFLDSVNPPVFQANAGNPTSGTFTWNTGNLSGRKHAYIFSIEAKDNYQIAGNPPVQAGLKTYQTFRVWVDDTTTCLFSGINDLQNKNVNIFPNPFTTQINITTEKSFQFTISDYVGRVVLAGESDGTIRTDELASGNYLLAIKNEELFSVRKVVKD